jgi:hypothetical protein
MQSVKPCRAWNWSLVGALLAPVHRHATIALVNKYNYFVESESAGLEIGLTEASFERFITFRAPYPIDEPDSFDQAANRLGVVREESESPDAPKKGSHPLGLAAPTTDFEYDVFISFKNLGPDGRPTRDCEIATELFEVLTSNGLRVFFSNVTLEKLGVAQYKKAIDRALDGTQILIAVGTQTEYLESDWVRYEWDGFFGDVISGIKPNGRLFAFVEGLRTADLPRTLRQNQVFFRDRDSTDSLVRFIRNALI